VVRTNVRPVLFIGFGDIECARGARVYLLSLLTTMRDFGCHAKAFFLQQSVAGSSEPADPRTVVILRAPGWKRSRLIPGLLWRAYELIWANGCAFWIALAGRRKSDICIVVGPGLLPLTPMLRVVYRKILYIQHGIAEEFLLSRGFIWRVKYVMTKLLERVFLRAFDLIVVVSMGMRAYCRDNYGVRRTLVMPCGVRAEEFSGTSEDRAQMRRALGIEDRFVFVYSGGAASWQCVAETIRFYELARQTISGAFLLVLSNEAEAWQRTLRRLDPEGYRILSVPHSGVGRYLRLADAGLLLRKQSLVNTVAAPVKFAEYLACGLPVIASPHVGDYASLVRDNRLGVLIEPCDDSGWPTALTDLMALMRDPLLKSRCLGAARSLDWETIGGNLLAVLRNGAPPIEENPVQLSVGDHAHQ
jgi:glycosyltransferase involved in cell wall biosynthesis